MSTYTPQQIAEILLSQPNAGSFDPLRIADVAYHLYHSADVDDSASEVREVLYTLMVMSEGPEFELTEAEFRDLVGTLTGRAKS
jgi:hypothetical protein